MPLFVKPTMNYRPDIDGLRAIAVLSVIFFHIDNELLPGGFVGVDIFFVISGYLITRNIIDSISNDDFSIVEFYRRRVKRIAPAMLVVVFSTIVFAQFFMLPEDAERAADSALWSLLSLSNFYFWLNLDASYFAESSNELPLLHLWSLGVEEQFYIFWPVFLIILYRKKSILTLSLVMAAAAILSFAFAEHTFDSDPSFSYYMLPTRAGELLLGALVAFAASNGIERKVRAAWINPLGWLGACLMIGSLFALSEQDVFPGWNAIPPTLGAALLILSGHCRISHFSRLLTFSPMVGVGLLSYSAYLWHWPILAFMRYGYGEVTFTNAGIAFLATFLLAWVTYRYVEQPARHVKSSAVRVFLFQYTIPAGALAFLSLGAMYIDGYGVRSFLGDYRTELASVQSQNVRSFTFNYVCQKQRIASTDLQDEICVIGPKPKIGARVILWGDSNASHYVGMLGSFAKDAGFNFRNISVGACPGIDGDPEPFVAVNRLADCRASLDIIRPAVDDFDVVILSSSWSSYDGNSGELLKATTNTAQRLAELGKLVIFLGKVPTIEGYDYRCGEKALSIPFLECPNPSNPVAAEIMEVNAALKSYAARTKNVEYFDATAYLCPNGTCSAFDENGLRIYRDFAHITMNASWKLGDKILANEGLPAPFIAINNWLIGLNED